MEGLCYGSYVNVLRSIHKACRLEPLYYCGKDAAWLNISGVG